MIKIGASAKIEEVSKKGKSESKEKKKITQISPSVSSTTIRPEVVDAKVSELHKHGTVTTDDVFVPALTSLEG